MLLAWSVIAVESSGQDDHIGMSMLGVSSHSEQRRHERRQFAQPYRRQPTEDCSSAGRDKKKVLEQMEGLVRGSITARFRGQSEPAIRLQRSIMKPKLAI